MDSRLLNNEYGGYDEWDDNALMTTILIIKVWQVDAFPEGGVDEDAWRHPFKGKGKIIIFFWT